MSHYIGFIKGTDTQIAYALQNGANFDPTAVLNNVQTSVNNVSQGLPAAGAATLSSTLAPYETYIIFGVLALGALWYAKKKRAI